MNVIKFGIQGSTGPPGTRVKVSAMNIKCQEATKQEKQHGVTMPQRGRAHVHENALLAKKLLQMWPKPQQFFAAGCHRGIVPAIVQSFLPNNK
jgi:hypothetical protein